MSIFRSKVENWRTQSLVVSSIIQSLVAICLTFFWYLKVYVKGLSHLHIILLSRIQIIIHRMYYKGSATNCVSFTTIGQERCEFQLVVRYVHVQVHSYRVLHHKKYTLLSVRSQTSLSCWTIFEASTGRKSFRQTLFPLDEFFYYFYNVSSILFVQFFMFEF